MPSQTDQALKDVAHKGATIFTHKVNPNKLVSIDPFTIIMFASLVINLIKMFQKCEEPSKDDWDAEDIKDVCRYSLTPQYNRILKRHIRRTVGWVNWWLHKNDYIESVLYLGRSTNATQLNTLLNNNNLNIKSVDLPYITRRTI